jgi:hypothetical protein
MGSGVCWWALLDFGSFWCALMYPGWLWAGPDLCVLLRSAVFCCIRSVLVHPAVFWRILVLSGVLVRGVDGFL